MLGITHIRTKKEKLLRVLLLLSIIVKGLIINIKNKNKKSNSGVVEGIEKS